MSPNLSRHAYFVEGQLPQFCDIPFGVSRDFASNNAFAREARCGAGVGPAFDDAHIFKTR
jgi:hypothetical protein